MACTEEDIMKMRLLVDGDGTGDDRRLNLLLKALIKWCNAEEDQQTCEMTYQRMLTQLAGIEWNMTKSRLAGRVVNGVLFNTFEHVVHSTRNALALAELQQIVTMDHLEVLKYVT